VPDLGLDRRPTLIGPDLHDDCDLARDFRTDWDPLIGLGAYAAASRELAEGFDALGNEYAARDSRRLGAEFDSLLASLNERAVDVRAYIAPEDWTPVMHAERKYRHLAALYDILHRQAHRNRSVAAAVAAILRRMFACSTDDLLPRGSPLTVAPAGARELSPQACDPLVMPRETRAGPRSEEDEDDPAGSRILARLEVAVASRPRRSRAGSWRTEPVPEA
jgi:hypothetical protein